MSTVDVISQLIIWTLATITLTGCVNASGTLREASRLVEQVRPDVNLGEVKVDVWRSQSTVEKWHGESTEFLSFPYVHRILEAQRPHFVRFGMEHALKILVTQRLAADAPQLPAFVVPGSPSTIVARAQAAGSLHTMTHELGHIASWRKGYWKRPGPYLWLDEGKAGDPHWIDLDSFIAGWAIEEGTAELTSIAAMQLTKPEVERTDIIDFANLAAGNALSTGMLAPLVIRTQQFAYGNGLRYVCARGGAEGLTLEERLEAAWAGFRGTSREILFPHETSTPSRLAVALRRDLETLEPRPMTATRWGAFLLFEVLSEHEGYEVAELLPVLKGYRDDILLSFEGDRHLWFTEWADVEVAEEFARRIWKCLPSAEVESAGIRVTVSWSGPERAKSWWTSSP